MILGYELIFPAGSKLENLEFPETVINARLPNPFKLSRSQHSPSTGCCGWKCSMELLNKNYQLS